jgi:carbon-monoxide dehydrogenase catalytic subunit
MAVENFSSRQTVSIPQETSPLVGGFSKEYIAYMLGGKYKASFKPLNDAIISGAVQGIVAVVGFNNPRVVQDARPWEFPRSCISVHASTIPGY